jgi:putative acetyltransferase
MPTPALVLRPIEAKDNSGIAAVIRSVMPEFGAGGPGFAIHDPEVGDMFAAYQRPRCSYFVIDDGKQILGGGGIAPLDGGDPDVCELKKMYFRPELRGLGFGQQMIEVCLKAAREHGYTKCYLETLKHMAAARHLYEKNGFERIKAPLGNTGHFGCDAWYVLSLDSIR